MPGGASATVSTVWQDHACKFGWRVDGIFPPGTDGTHVNSVAQSKDMTNIATGDDYGMVNIYRNPCRDGNQARGYRGHSEHVTRVRWIGDKGEYLISAGGQDQTLIQWKLKDNM
jgi:WD40 repeat protein